MSDHCFISYSTADALEFARRLADELEGGEDQFIDAWLDKRDIDPARDWDDQIVEGIKTCTCMAFVMTKDSTAPGSMCKNEWMWALKYKKIVIPLRLHKEAELPFGLGSRQWIDFTGEFEHGLAKLRKFLREMDSPKGILQSYQDRLADAQRDLRRARGDEENRIKAEIEELNAQIQIQQKIVDNPKAAQEQTQKNIEAGLERERQPEKPMAAKAMTKFINPPPGIAPTYFQDRLIENQQIVAFLNDDAQRLLTIVGRAGIGKTALVCRLLKGLERGVLPDDLGEMKVAGIVYLSESGSHRSNFATIFEDLSKLLPKETAESLQGLYKDPKTSTGDKMHALLDAFPSGRVVLLLDNFENLVDSEQRLRDSELFEALEALLCGNHHAVKAIITTRIAPRDLAVCEPGRQRYLSLDDGLESPFAENVLREMDADDRVGLKTASDALLAKARVQTRGYPRALEALYAILSVDRYTTLEELLEIKLPDEVVEKLVGEAFSRLDGTAQKVMQALAIYKRPVSPAAIDYLLQPHLPSADSALALNRLVNMHFARREAGRYYLHPADQEYAFGLIPAGEGQGESELTQQQLTLRAADYFAAARKPRAEWKKLDDLSAQLAEFDLRCAAGDFDTAAIVLTDIDGEYLLLWGHNRLMIQLHESLQGKIRDKSFAMLSVARLGLAYQVIGRINDFIKCEEQALEIARARKDRYNEGAWLGNLGNAYAALGDARKAIEFYEQALVIAREIGDRSGEGNDLGNLGLAYADLGDARQAIEFHEQALVIAREICDKRNEGNQLGNLGLAYAALGDARKAIAFYEQALDIAREIGDKRNEGNQLGNLGLACAALGDARKAIEFYEQTLTITREIGDRRHESNALKVIGDSFLTLEEYQKAKKNYQQSIQIADEISNRQVQNSARQGLAEAYLLQNNLSNARATIESVLQYDVPENNHNASALHGIIALRQGDEVTARGAFVRAIGQADEILAKTPEYYSALDEKGLALCGLILCRGDSRIAPGDAIERFNKARKIAPHAGIVKSTLRLFDELAKCDKEGILKNIRQAVEGH